MRARSANIWATPHGYKSRHSRSTIEGAQVHLAAQHKTHTRVAVCCGRRGGSDTTLTQASPSLLQIGLPWFFFFSSIPKASQHGLRPEQHVDAPRQARRRWCVHSTSTRATVPVLERTQRHCDPWNSPRLPLFSVINRTHPAAPLLV